MVHLSGLRLREARSRLSAHLRAPCVATLGSITLGEGQRWLAARAGRALDRDGGCLVADEVGRGKTYVSLALARGRGSTVVIAPASLRDGWARATARAQVPCAFVSHEALSRGRTGSSLTKAPELVIVDESHRFRTSATNRYLALARLTAHAPVILLSATPLQNSLRDLHAQLALFLGERAFQLDDDQTAFYVLRSGTGVGSHDVAPLPVVAEPVWVDVGVDDGDVLRELLALPPPPRAADAGDAGALRTLGLVRAWASSRAALASMLERRARTLAAIEQSLECGLLPSRRELRSWHGADGDVQLGFPTLLVGASTGGGVRSELLQAAGAERRALRAIARRMAERADPDAARVAAVRSLRRAHPDDRILAFSELASTVRAMFSAMRHDDGVALLTSGEARIASGPLPRRDVLARFAPRALGFPEPPRRERITLLLTTDLLSEGVNLQDAGVLVHLDLPWNPMRLEQRVGRVRRPGGASTVHSYLLAPPAGARLLLDVERRLRRKLARAARAVGPMLGVLPALTPAAVSDCAAAPAAPSTPVTSAATLGEVAQRIIAWRRRDGRVAHTHSPFVAAADSATSGWLAALDDGRLLGAIDGGPADEHGSLPSVTRMAEGGGRPAGVGETEAALAAARSFLEEERVAVLCGIVRAPTALAHALSRALSVAWRSAPFHERAAITARAGRIRNLLSQSRSLGAEWELEALAARPPRCAGTVVEWLDALLQAARLHHAVPPERMPRIAVLVLLGPAQGTV